MGTTATQPQQQPTTVKNSVEPDEVQINQPEEADKEVIKNPAQENEFSTFSGERFGRSNLL